MTYAMMTDAELDAEIAKRVFGYTPGEPCLRGDDKGGAYYGWSCSVCGYQDDVHYDAHTAYARPYSTDPTASEEVKRWAASPPRSWHLAVLRMDGASAVVSVKLGLTALDGAGTVLADRVYAPTEPCAVAIAVLTALDAEGGSG